MRDELAVYTGQRLDKLKPCIISRIEMLGKMNDRRRVCLAAGNREQLLALAREYKAKKMPRMAKVVRREAEQWKK